MPAPRFFALVSHPACLEHVAGPGHPERPERLIAVEEALRAGGLWDRAIHLAPREASPDDLLLAHTPEHIARVREACARGAPLEPDTGTCPESWRAARLAAGAGLTAADALVAGDITRAFCLVRPPGHHAESNRAMGFCLFNNVAVTARHLRRRHRVERVAIIDFDVHHGNGTEEIFREDPSVMYCSLHQYGPNPLNPLLPFYPGSGARDETGRGPGEGTTVNVPLPAGTRYDTYVSAFRKHALPELDRFAPAVLLLSAGFDAHTDDPLALMRITTEDYESLTRFLVEIADRHCAGRIISMLEGGYNLEALAAAALAHAAALSRVS